MFLSSWLCFYMLSIVGRGPIAPFTQTWVFIGNMSLCLKQRFFLLRKIAQHYDSKWFRRFVETSNWYLIPPFWHPPILFWKFAHPPVKPLYIATFKLFKKAVPTLLTLFWNPHYWVGIVIRERKRQFNFQSVEDSKKVILSPFYWISLATPSPIFIENPTQTLI